MNMEEDTGDEEASVEEASEAVSKGFIAVGRYVVMEMEDLVGEERDSRFRR